MDLFQMYIYVIHLLGLTAGTREYELLRDPSRGPGL